LIPTLLLRIAKRPALAPITLWPLSLLVLRRLRRSVRGIASAQPVTVHCLNSMLTSFTPPPQSKLLYCYHAPKSGIILEDLHLISANFTYFLNALAQRKKPLAIIAGALKNNSGNKVPEFTLSESIKYSTPPPSNHYCAQSVSLIVPRCFNAPNFTRELFTVAGHKTDLSTINHQMVECGAGSQFATCTRYA
jgi:hypothetical protein